MVRHNLRQNYLSILSRKSRTMFALKCVVPENTHYLSIRKGFFLETLSPFPPLNLCFFGLKQRNPKEIAVSSVGGVLDIFWNCTALKSYFFCCCCLQPLKTCTKCDTNMHVENCPVVHSLAFLLLGTSYMPTPSYPWLFSSTHLLHLGG